MAPTRSTPPGLLAQKRWVWRLFPLLGLGLGLAGGGVVLLVLSLQGLIRPLIGGDVNSINTRDLGTTQHQAQGQPAPPRSQGSPDDLNTPFPSQVQTHVEQGQVTIIMPPAARSPFLPDVEAVDPNSPTPHQNPRRSPESGPGGIWLLGLGGVALVGLGLVPWDQVMSRITMVVMAGERLWADRPQGLPNVLTGSQGLQHHRLSGGESPQGYGEFSPDVSLIPEVLGPEEADPLYADPLYADPLYNDRETSALDPQSGLPQPEPLPLPDQSPASPPTLADVVDIRKRRLPPPWLE